MTKQGRPGPKLGGHESEQWCYIEVRAYHITEVTGDFVRRSRPCETFLPISLLIIVQFTKFKNLGVAPNRKKWHIFSSGLRWVWLTALCVRVLTKFLKDRLNVNSGLCQTHCKQVPVFLRHFNNYMYR